MKALIELHFQHEALPRFIENVLRSTLSYPNETSKECIQFLNKIGCWIMYTAMLVFSVYSPFHLLFYIQNLNINSFGLVCFHLTICEYEWHRIRCSRVTSVFNKN